ncbi:hypothetical protein QSV34_06475 [Porticoccus sp. W117]|uniref:hypothetical protein n=1 Tax=Porticoccus sp. W117 TaxID=3054777 RepID=UPI0025954420|nr:hypothetical protein [Porticoccus sp. W117]MDM3870998.1 hypothetical protein [Porticoccus sp. W117]
MPLNKHMLIALPRMGCYTRVMRKYFLSFLLVLLPFQIHALSIDKGHMLTAEEMANFEITIRSLHKSESDWHYLNIGSNKFCKINKVNFVPIGLDETGIEVQTIYDSSDYFASVRSKKYIHAFFVIYCEDFNKDYGTRIFKIRLDKQ